MYENRVWIRITNGCNSKCVFCLDSNSIGDIIENESIINQIKSSYKQGFFNKIVISGGEASINPRFGEYINLAKKTGYQKIQTITNGILFENEVFCNKIINEGLDEITFSIHGHSEKLHDYLTGVPGSYNKALKGLLNIKKYFPQIIVNIDIVLNKYNIDSIPSFIRFFNKLGIYEFDLLQIIPFGRAYNSMQKLFFNPEEKLGVYKEIGELSKIPGMHIWTNRLHAEYLEGYEKLIQDPNKIKTEILGEGKNFFQEYFYEGKTIECKGERCKYCFIKDLCTTIDSYKKELPLEGNKIIINNLKSNIDNKNIKYFILRPEEPINKIYELFGINGDKMINKMNELELFSNQEIVNIPKCIRNSNNNFTFEKYADLKKSDSLEEFTDIYINNLYRKKSLRCKDCIYDKKCKGLHINFIKAYGFNILKPIISSL